MQYLFIVIGALVLAGAGWYVVGQNETSTEPALIAEPSVSEAPFETDSMEEGTAEVYVVDEADMIDAPQLISEFPTGEITAAEATGIQFMREEEKLAHDVYQALYAIWGVPIFSNIARSEQTHMDAMLTLIERYNLTDPALAEPGAFNDATLAKLYTDLVAEGKQSLTDAYRVGAYIEDLDIKDLAAYIAATEQPDVALVYENLQRGSRNHLRAFNRQLVATTGNNYEPQFISVTEFQDIIGGDTERGPGGGRRN